MRNKLLTWLQNIISFLIFDWNWAWLEILIGHFCEMEMSFRLLKNEELLDNISTCDMVVNGTSYADAEIPQGIYCGRCIFRSWSRLATFLYGSQSSGYCYYLGKGDFSYLHATDLLWDGCKCCGYNDDEDDYNESMVDCLPENYLNEPVVEPEQVGETETEDVEEHEVIEQDKQVTTPPVIVTPVITAKGINVPVESLNTNF